MKRHVGNGDSTTTKTMAETETEPLNSREIFSKTPSIKSTDDDVDENRGPKSTIKDDAQSKDHVEPAKKKLKSDDTEASIKKFTSTTDTEVKPPEGIAERDFNRFPEKLLKILDSGEFADIFSWSSSGKSFVIHRPYDLISQVLTKHFDAKEDMKFDSFLRKLYRWGFSKKTVDDEEGDEEGAHIYFHINFQKGSFDLCAKVTCTSKPTTSRPSAHQKNDAANSFMPYRAGMVHPQRMAMFPGLLPMMSAPQSHQAALIGRDPLHGQSQLGNLQNSDVGALPGAAALGRGEYYLHWQRQELRERELVLLQQQQLYNAHAGASSMLGQPSALNNRFPPLQPFDQQQYPGIAPSNVNPNSILEAVRLGQDINRFERDILRFQQGNAMLTQTNGTGGGLMPGQDHRRLMYDAQAGILTPSSSSSSRVDTMLPAERQMFGERAFADRGMLPTKNMSGVGNSLPTQYAPLRGAPSSATDAEELRVRQRRMLLASQEAQQSLLNSSTRKRGVNGISSNHQSSSSDKDDLQPDSKRTIR